MTEFRDWRGTAIHVGLRIVYPVRHNASVTMIEAEILEILPPGPRDRRMRNVETHPGWAARRYAPEKRFNLVVRRLHSSAGLVPQPGRRVHLTNTIGVTVVGRPGL